jgi:uncharacterized damage-inducible protein DinB
MSKTALARPDQSEYAPYYQGYVSLVPDGDIVSTLTRQLEETQALLRSIPETRADYSYAEGKWSIKEVVGHIIDAERIFAYRALRIARNDQTPLSGFDQNDYVRAGSFNVRDLASLIEEFGLVRLSNVHLFRSFDDQTWLRRGVANDVEVSVRALAFIMAGHERHHLGVLQDKYL